MKNYIFALLLVILSQTSTLAQIAINSDNSPANPTAMLDLSNSDKGVLIPRMSTAQRDAIPHPISPGLVVYLTDSNAFSYYNGSQWKVQGMDHLGNHIAERTLDMKGRDIINGGLIEATAIKIDGKTLVTDPNTNFVGINVSSPKYTLDIFDSSSNPVSIGLESNIGNGSFASIYTETQFAGIGFESNSDFRLGPITGVTDIPDETGLTVRKNGKVGIGTDTPSGALEVSGGDVIVNNGANPNFQFKDGTTLLSEIKYENDNLIISQEQSEDITFLTNNTTRMRITKDGKVGIGNITPIRKLDVDGTIAMDNGLANKDAEFTSYDDNGSAYWQSPQDKVGYSVIPDQVEYPANTNWQVIAGPINMFADADEVLVFQGQFTAWNSSWNNRNPFDIRVQIDGCSSTVYTEEMESWTYVAQNPNVLELPYPYLDYITAPCSGNLTFTLKAKSRNGKGWITQTRSLIVNKY